MNILLTISYDGTNYCGWQRQPNGKTIQGCLEKTLEELYRQEIIVLGASRTDAGVHARGQRGMYSIKDDGGINIPIEKIPFAVNAQLPEDIRIIKAEEVPLGFNPISRTKRKTYEYCIYNGVINNPMQRLYSEHIYLPLDIEKMKEASRHFIGEHDFKAFCAAGGSAKTSIRIIYDIDLLESANMITNKITGNGFLYNMVRIIAGTLVYVGLGKIMPSDIPGIILSRDRARAGKTLAAKGLTLLNVDYNV